MSENIENKFGLDASQALQALTALDQGFATLSRNLANSGQSFQVFNSNAGRTVAALIQIRDRANEAANALGRLNKVPRPPSVSGGGLPAVPGGAGGASSGQALLTGQAAASAFNQLLGQTAPAVNANAQAMRNGAKATSSYAVSFETLARVFATQLLVRALNQIRTAVEDSIGSFIQFSNAISQIQTIAENETFDQLAGEIRALSDQFNVPLLDVAKAKYDALSNGFEKAGESTQILTAAMKFAKIGVSTTTQAVDLLSGTLNAYGQDASYAETLTAKLFETIRVGKVVGSELVTAFGRVAPIGKEIGATQDELLAAFSSITIGGVKASEAATQIRATLSSLLKPSQDMSVALRKLGFDSGEQAVQALGLQGALKGVISTTNGSVTAISSLFPNIRALNGVLRETGTGADIYQKHLTQIRAATQAIANEKYEVFIKSNAFQVESDINKLKNFFTADLGKTLTNQLKGVFDVVSVNTFMSAITALVPLVGVLGGAVATYSAWATVSGIASRALAADLFTLGTAAGLSATKIAILTATIKGAIGAGAALFASYQAGQFAGQLIVDSINAPAKALEESLEKERQFRERKVNAETELANQTSDAQVQQLLQYNAAARKSYFQEVDDAKDKNTTLLEDSKATLDKLVSIRAKYATDLQRAATTAENDIVQSKKRTADLTGQLEDRVFNQRLNNLYKSGSKSAAAIRSQDESARALQLALQGSTKLGGANTPDEKEAGENAFKRAEAYAQQAASSAATSGNIIAQQDAERVLQSIIRQKIDAEEKYQATRKSAASQLEAGAAKERERVTKLQQAEKKFLDKSSVLDKNGNLLPADQLKKNKEEALKALADIKGLMFGPGSEFQFGDLLSFDKLQKDFNEKITGKELKALFTTTPENINNVYNQLQNTLEKFGPVLLKFAPDPKALAQFKGGDFFNEFEKQIQSRADEGKDFRANAGQIDGLTSQMQAELAKGMQKITQERGFWERMFDGGDGAQAVIDASPRTDTWNGISDQQRAGMKKVAEEYIQIRKDAEKLLSTPENATTSSVAALSKRFYANQGAAGKQNLDLPGQEANRTEEALQALQKYVELQERRIQLDAKYAARGPEIQEGIQKQGADSFDAFAANAERMKAEEAAKAKSANEQAVPAYRSQAEASAETARNAERAAAAAQAAAQAGLFAPAQQSNAPKTPTGGSYSAGGIVPFQYFDQGGAAKGIDTINAKLAPNEMVMKPDTTSKFFSQLQAMNAGLTPRVERTSSGDTFQIGDIHVNGASSPKETAREVINQIRREQRRGSGNKLR